MPTYVRTGLLERRLEPYRSVLPGEVAHDPRASGMLLLEPCDIVHVSVHRDPPVILGRVFLNLRPRESPVDFPVVNVGPLPHVARGVLPVPRIPAD